MTDRAGGEMTDDLVAFIRARLDEDERLADAARRETANDRDECEWYRSGSEGIYTKDTNNGFLQGSYGYLDEAISDHVVQQQPRRVLRGVEAKRRLLDLIVQSLPGNCDCEAYGHHADAETALRLLAAERSDHPDYREEWKP